MNDIITIQMKTGRIIDVNKNPLDTKYEALDCRVEIVESGTQEYEDLIQKIMNVEQSYKPNYDPDTIKVHNIYKIDRGNEEKTYSRHMTNQNLLFHGSRGSNFVGLLSRGILLPKIVVSEGLSTRTDFGYLGAGVYFSDSFFDSIKYAHPPTNSTLRFMLVCNVAMGNEKKYTKITSELDRSPPGYNSCFGVGRHIDPNSDFDNNEIVVYNSNQYKLQYLVEFECIN